jgi:nucleotide-binding universal stress UspA family protein
MLERILVPLDGSELADQILAPMRATLARSSDVSLLRVVPARELPKDHTPGQDPLTLARKHLAARRDQLTARGICAHARLAVGDPASKILDGAREHGSTLIVMSTHGRTGAARFLRGSVAERVLRHSPVPVLVANPRALGGREEPRFRKILVPLDGSERSAEILPLVVELAKLHGSEVVLFYSIPVITVPEPDFESGPVMSVAEGVELLEPFQRSFYDVPVKRLALTGDPASNILSLVESEKIDLIAMTTHGRSGPSRWFVGSVAEQVTRHATCPLLIKQTAGPPLTASVTRETTEAALSPTTPEAVH